MNLLLNYIYSFIFLIQGTVLNVSCSLDQKSSTTLTYFRRRCIAQFQTPKMGQKKLLLGANSTVAQIVPRYFGSN